MTDLSFWYRNHRGEQTIRRVRFLGFRFGVSHFYTEPQWLLRAFDEDKQAEREFAVTRMAPLVHDRMNAEDEARRLHNVPDEGLKAWR